jgi:hypothetical protein
VNERAHLLNRSMVVLALLGVASCTAAASPQYELFVRVESDPGVPLAGAQVSRHGVPLGTSDKKGVIALSVAGTPGEEVELETTCPAGHAPPNTPLSITLRTLAEEGRRPEYHVSCAPLVRSLVVSVRAQNGPRLPVKYLGKEIARTDNAGAAHALLKVRPGETVTISLDTSAPERSGLMPQNPELKLTAPARDDVVLFDQAFTEAKKAKREKRVKRGPVPIKL